MWLPAALSAPSTPVRHARGNLSVRRGSSVRRPKWDSPVRTAPPRSKAAAHRLALKNKTVARRRAPTRATWQQRERRVAAAKVGVVMAKSSPAAAKGTLLATPSSSLVFQAELARQLSTRMNPTSAGAKKASNEMNGEGIVEKKPAALHPPTAAAKLFNPVAALVNRELTAALTLRRRNSSPKRAHKIAKKKVPPRVAPRPTTMARKVVLAANTAVPAAAASAASAPSVANTTSASSSSSSFAAAAAGSTMKNDSVATHIEMAETADAAAIGRMAAIISLASVKAAMPVFARTVAVLSLPVESTSCEEETAERSVCTLPYMRTKTEFDAAKEGKIITAASVCNIEDAPWKGRGTHSFVMSSIAVASAAMAAARAAAIDSWAISVARKTITEARNSFRVDEMEPKEEEDSGEESLSAQASAFVSHLMVKTATRVAKLKVKTRAWEQARDQAQAQAQQMDIIGQQHEINKHNQNNIVAQVKSFVDALVPKTLSHMQREFIAAKETEATNLFAAGVVLRVITSARQELVQLAATEQRQVAVPVVSVAAVAAAAEDTAADAAVDISNVWTDGLDSAEVSVVLSLEALDTAATLSFGTRIRLTGPTEEVENDKGVSCSWTMDPAAAFQTPFNVRSDTDLPNALPIGRAGLCGTFVPASTPFQAMAKIMSVPAKKKIRPRVAPKPKSTNNNIVYNAVITKNTATVKRSPPTVAPKPTSKKAYYNRTPGVVSGNAPAILAAVAKAAAAEGAIKKVTTTRHRASLHSIGNKFQQRQSLNANGDKQTRPKVPELPQWKREWQVRKAGKTTKTTTPNSISKHTKAVDDIPEWQRISQAFAQKNRTRYGRHSCA